MFSPNAGKYGTEITPYLDTFHAVITKCNHEIRNTTIVINTFLPVLLHIIITTVVINTLLSSLK